MVDHNRRKHRINMGNLVFEHRCKCRDRFRTEFDCKTEACLEAILVPLTALDETERCAAYSYKLEHSRRFLWCIGCMSRLDYKVLPVEFMSEYEAINLQDTLTIKNSSLCLNKERQDTDAQREQSDSTQCVHFFQLSRKLQYMVGGKYSEFRIKRTRSLL